MRAERPEVTLPRGRRRSDALLPLGAGQGHGDLVRDELTAALAGPEWAPKLLLFGPVGVLGATTHLGHHLGLAGQQHLRGLLARDQLVAEAGIADRSDGRHDREQVVHLVADGGDRAHARHSSTWV